MKLFLKLHPAEYGSWKNIYKTLSNEIQIIDSNDKDIHYYLANSDYVVGINSTALFEARFYPVDVFILEEEGYQGMKIMLEAKRAVLVHSSQELVSCITAEHSANNQKIDDFFQRNAIKNINKEIEGIIRKHREI